jgi:hypothetical protein
MVQIIEKDGKTLFACEQCGFRYHEERLAGECEKACVHQGICRTDIAKQAIKPNDHSQ